MTRQERELIDSGKEFIFKHLPSGKYYSNFHAAGVEEKSRATRFTKTAGEDFLRKYGEVNFLIEEV